MLGGVRLWDADLKAITLKITDANREVTVEGEKEPDKGTCTLAIFEMKDAGSLRVCYDLSGTDFPKEFKAPKGTQLYLVGYRRPRE